MNNKIKTDEQLIEAVNQYMESHPNATRNQVVLNSHGNHQRIRDLDKKGLISLPKAQVRGGVWRKYFYIQSRDKMFTR
jgi:hypothetical protein